MPGSLSARERQSGGQREGGGECHARETRGLQTDEDGDTNKAGVETFQRSTQSQGIQCFTAVETEKSRDLNSPRLTAAKCPTWVTGATHSIRDLCCRFNTCQ